MATAEQQGIAVENPATGAVIATVPVLSADDVRALVMRARAAQPAWEALGFEERGRVLRRAQKWTVDNADRIVETIVSETGKTHDDAVINEILYAAGAFGFWAKHAARLPGGREGPLLEPARGRPQARDAATGRSA